MADTRRAHARIATVPFTGGAPTAPANVVYTVPREGYARLISAAVLSRACTQNNTTDAAAERRRVFAFPEPARGTPTAGSHPPLAVFRPSPPGHMHHHKSRARLIIIIVIIGFHLIIFRGAAAGIIRLND